MLIQIYMVLFCYWWLILHWGQFICLDGTFKVIWDMMPSSLKDSHRRVRETCYIFLYRDRQKYLTIRQHSCEWNRWRGEFVLERPSNETQSISVAVERWSVEHRAFAVQTYFWNNDSVVTRRLFRRHFNFHRNDSVPSRNTVLLWVRNQRNSVCRKKKPSRKRAFTLNCWEHRTIASGFCQKSSARGNVLTTRDATHNIQEANTVIKMLSDKDNFSNKFTFKGSTLFILF